MIKNNILYTSPLEEVLPGVTRGRIIAVAKNIGIEFEEKKISYKEIDNIDAMFISGTSPKILPIKEVDDVKFDVNNVIMRKLMKAFDKEVENYINAFKK